mmetsp:Transcript_28400/g.88058  ORF Transcript_28400/g.88058 Transcript_28400/m.88058 type:complete len:242 (+) Transcript_28400:545-1270(+)
MLLLPLIMTSEALHVSFLGNSFTYFNDLPSCVVSACRAAGVGATAAEHTVGGEALSGHLENERARALLAAPADALVVQDNSVNPGRASEERFEESLRALDDIAERAAHVEHVVVYGSWGHRDGSVYEATRDAYPDFPTMQRRTEEGCEAYVNRLAARRPRGRVSLAPVGDAFRRVYESEAAPLEESSLFYRLYAPDAFHPSKYGTFLAACVIAETLRLPLPDDWKPSDAAALVRRSSLGAR